MKTTLSANKTSIGKSYYNLEFCIFCKILQNVKGKIAEISSLPRKHLVEKLQVAVLYFWQMFTADLKTIGVYSCLQKFITRNLHC